MSGFADLVLQASNNTGGRLFDFPRQITEGTTVEWTLTGIVDAAGDDIDLSSATIVCKVVSAVTGAATDPEVLSLTATGGVGTLTVSATSTETANLATGVTKPADSRKLWWYCTVTSGSNKVQFWGPSGSPFNISAQG